MNLPLNIDWQQIILHLFNFVILFAILYILLYKPVKDFMQKRIDYYKKLDGDAKENLEESEKAKQEYTQKLADADQEIAKKREQARKAMESAGDMKIQEAEEEARRIIADAQAKNEKDRARMLKEVQNEISDMVASAAEKLSIGASTSQVYDEFLDAAKRSEDDES